MSLSNPCQSQIWVCTPESQSSAIKAPAYNHPVIMCFYTNSWNTTCFSLRDTVITKKSWPKVPSIKPFSQQKPTKVLKESYREIMKRLSA